MTVYRKKSSSCCCCYSPSCRHYWNSNGHRSRPSPSYATARL